MRNKYRYVLHYSKIGNCAVAVNPRECRKCTLPVMPNLSRFVTASATISAHFKSSSMNKELISSDIRVMGFIVDSFPLGIADAFEKLQVMLPDGKTRVFYGISDCSNSHITYKAAVLEASKD